MFASFNSNDCVPEKKNIREDFIDMGSISQISDDKIIYGIVGVLLLLVYLKGRFGNYSIGNLARLV